MKGIAAAAGFAAALLLGGGAHAAEIGAINLTVAHSWSGVAPCLSPDGQAESVVAGKLEALAAGAPVADATVAGVVLKAQPEPLIAAFRQMTRLLPKGAEVRVAAGCHDAGCAARALFGAENGPRLLLLAARYHFNASDLGEQATRPWTTAELDQLIAALEDMPPSLFPLDRAEYRALVHRHYSDDFMPGQAMFELAAQAGDGQPGVIVAQGWHKASGAERRAIIVHELAHEFVRARGGGIGWDQGWRAAVAADTSIAREDNRFSSASAYAGKNLGEDFAESVVAYRYMAPLLKRRAPHRYAFLRERVFDGLEYGSAATCAAPGGLAG